LAIYNLVIMLAFPKLHNQCDLGFEWKRQPTFRISSDEFSQIVAGVYSIRPPKE